MPALPPVEPQATEPLQLLLLDDDAAARRSLQLLLRAHGYRVKSYALGSALLADPAIQPCDCLIIDYRMDDIDGLTVHRRLREGGWQGAAILLSAYHSPDLAERALAQGFAAALAKPAREHLLLDTVKRLAPPGAALSDRPK